MEESKGVNEQPPKGRGTLGVGGGQISTEQIKARFLSGSRGDAIIISVKTNKVLSKSFASKKVPEGQSDLEDLRGLIDKSKAAFAEITSQLKSSQLAGETNEPPVVRQVDVIPSVKKPVEQEKRVAEEVEGVARDKGSSRDLERELKRLHKSNLLRLTEAAEDAIVPVRSLSAIKRAKDKARRRAHQGVSQAKVYREICVTGPMRVGQVAHALSEKVADLIRQLLQLGVVAAANDVIDEDTIEIVSTCLGHKVLKVAPELGVREIIRGSQDKEGELQLRPPVITIMGHVDHGKTSLLDALRQTNVVAGEFGGITQHIGAYQVDSGKGLITVIDTPGHEAFKQMRKMGAQVTDIVVLVVAADSGVQPQTIEAIQHAHDAKLPIIVAINKVDKPGANVELTKSMLLQRGLLPEDMGGETIMVPISAKSKLNLDLLKDSILLVAEMLNLRANSNAPASGVVIESKMSAGTGVSATVLVQRGRLSVGDILVAGGSSGKVRRMLNSDGKDMDSALPSTPVEVLGFDMPPKVGDQFVAVESEKKARGILRTEERSKTSGSVVRPDFSGVISQGVVKHLPLVLKVDAQGSFEAILDSLAKKSHDRVRLRILRAGVGEVNESDVQLASTFGGVLFAFNIGVVSQAQLAAQKAGITIRQYKVIYDLLDEVGLLLNELLDPVKREELVGAARVLQIFENSKVGKIAGCRVTKGSAKDKCKVKVSRNGKLLYETFVKELRREKDEVKSVREGFDCGISMVNAKDILEGDVLEFIEIIEEKQKFF